jgi:hypothetical protein
VIRARLRKPVGLLIVGVAAAGLATGWDSDTASSAGSVRAGVSSTRGPATSAVTVLLDAARRIDDARRQGMQALDAVVADLERETARAGAAAEDWHALAEVLLERSLLRDVRKGMAVGRPTHTELPTDLAADVAAGIRAAEKAIEAGDDSAEIHRILSALLSRQVTGIGSALKLRGRMEAELALAEERAPDHPKVLIARACGQLFAPNRLFGHDPVAAEQKFVRAAEALPTDERPWMFASMCAWLQGDGERALTHIDAAAKRNPDHPYIREVAQRLRAGAPDPFGPDA